MRIYLNHVSKILRKTTVVDDVSLSFESGVITGIKGINGSGKTMLMRLISGLIRPSEGEIWIEEKKLGVDISFPESIGVLIENPVLQS